MILFIKAVVAQATRVYMPKWRKCWSGSRKTLVLAVLTQQPVLLLCALTNGAGAKTFSIGLTQRNKSVVFATGVPNAKDQWPIAAKLVGTVDFFYSKKQTLIV